MKRIAIYLMLVLSMAVFAQQQSDPGEEEPPVNDLLIEQEVDDPDLDDEQTAEDLPAAADSEAPDTGLSDDGMEGEYPGEGESAEDIGDEVLDADDADILPDEEISEDYPVPLPSDI